MLVVVMALAAYQLLNGPAVDDPMPPGQEMGVPPHATPAGSAVSAPGEARLLAAWRAGESGVMVTVGGRVVKVLPDDDDGSRHQRFIIRLRGEDHTVLVAHNIDLADRVPLEEGDTVTLRGQYEFNEQGGLLHWTHADPDGRHEGGWIECKGRRTE